MVLLGFFFLKNTVNNFFLMSPVSEKNMREQTELFYHHFSCSSDLSFETPSTAEPISVGVNVYNYTVYSVAVTQIHKQRRRKSILIFMDLVPVSESEVTQMCSS